MVLWCSLTWEDSNVEDLECGEGVSSYVDCLGTAFCNDDVIYSMIVSLMTVHVLT